MRASLSLLAFMLPGIALARAGVMTTNSASAASLQAAAVIPGTTGGTYTFTNVATGEKLTYVVRAWTSMLPKLWLTDLFHLSQPTGNHIFPAKVNPGTEIRITPHQHANWIRLSFGTKNKCLSSAWGGTYDNAAVAYVCAVGSSGQDTTLEQTKQWWLAVAIGNTAGKVTSSTNQMLIAAQADSVATRNAKVAAQEAAFNKRSFDADDDEASSTLFEGFTPEELSEFSFDGSDDSGVAGGESGLKKRNSNLTRRGHKHHHHASKAAIASAKRARAAHAKKTNLSSAGKRAATGGKVIGTFYILPSDHLIDLATRALTAEVVVSRGIKTTALTPWSKGNKAQQWVLTEC
ncbi:hypothetical protein P7C70_g6182, partial [Phenoliferia sp. Uapishka_3]